MKKFVTILLAAAMAAIFVLPVYAGGGSEPEEEVIKIGALLDFTGPVADLGPKFQAGIELALEEVGYEVAGHPIELIVEDSATSVEAAVEKYKKLVDKDKINLCIGPLMGDAHLALAPLAAE